MESTLQKLFGAAGAPATICDVANVKPAQGQEPDRPDGAEVSRVAPQQKVDVHGSELPLGQGGASLSSRRCSESGDTTEYESSAPRLEEGACAGLRETVEALERLNEQQAKDLDKYAKLLEKHKRLQEACECRKDLAPNLKDKEDKELKLAREEAKKANEKLLQEASRLSRMDLVRQALRDPAVNVNAKNSKGFTPLYLAAERGFVDVVKRLLIAGADVTIGNGPDNFTALCRASQLGLAEIVDLLLSHEPKTQLEMPPDQAMQEKNSPLHLASLNGRLQVVQKLLAAKAPPGSTNKEKNTPLHLACSEGHFDVAKVLIEVGRAPIDDTNNKGRTPLHLACIKGCRLTVKLLLDNKADPTKRDSTGLRKSTGKTPLNLATEGRHTAVIGLLQQHLN
ncbi:hypothetical protein Agub_g3102 [Astrephomene gubernaculifera]|uniref:Uncharacterized protein n=1 Tax=Astrephomene gubernaculifera TaxID=47775 RepID=A0AAD3DLT0_9CHLO|nr:hypothetical protein Agub_g3102 [Astrephomene gubernaculifera]